MMIAFGPASTGVFAAMTLLSGISPTHGQKADPAAVAEAYRRRRRGCEIGSARTAWTMQNRNACAGPELHG